MIEKRNVLAIIGSGYMAANFADNAKEMGIRSISFSVDPNPYVINHCDAHYVIDIFDIDSIVDICRKERVTGVIATTELTISIAAEIASILNLPGVPVDVAKNITDKGYVRQHVSNAKLIKQPKFWILSPKDMVPDNIEYPVIVKPVNLGGKRGISVVNNQDEIDEAVDYAFNAIKVNDKKVLIEEYLVGGKEYSVESLSCNHKHYVIQVTEKISSGPPHCIELGHMQPARIDSDKKELVCRAVSDCLSACGIDNTITHTEIKIIDGDIYLIEINTRAGGDHISYPLTHLSTGYPYLKGGIQIACNCFEEPDFSQFENNYCGVLFIVKQTRYLEGLFKDCEKYDWLYKKNHVTDELIELDHNNGFNTNFIMYLSKAGIPKEIKEYI